MSPKIVTHVPGLYSARGDDMSGRGQTEIRMIKFDMKRRWLYALYLLEL